jgi:hypothetical protein
VLNPFIDRSGRVLRIFVPKSENIADVWRQLHNDFITLLLTTYCKDLPNQGEWEE